MKQKVRIIAFLELLFAVDKDDRSLKFERIAAATLVDKNDVEFTAKKTDIKLIPKSSLYIPVYWNARSIGNKQHRIERKNIQDDVLPQNIIHHKRI